MKIFFKIVLLVFLLQSCANRNVTIKNKNLIKDSLQIFENIDSVEVKGKIIDGNKSLIYESVDEEEFFRRLKVNIKDIRYFSRDKVFNENIKLKEKYNSLNIFCNQESLNDRPKIYFYHSLISDFLIIQKIHFEDTETLLIDIRDKKVEKNLLGMSVSVNSKRNLFFYNDNNAFAPEENTKIVLFKVKNSKIEKVFSSEVKWFTSFSFFDKDSNYIYYLHSYYNEQYNIVSTYAKMEISTH